MDFENCEANFPQFVVMLRILQVNYLRSCGVLQRSEDSSPDSRINQSLQEKNSTYNAIVDDQTNEKPRQGDIAPVKQLRKCFSGPMLFDVHSPLRNDS